MRILFEVLKVAARNLVLEETHLGTSHGLQNELLVVAEEEETSTLPAGFAYLEDARDVEVRKKRFNNG